jgi:hypothetical protein
MKEKFVFPVLGIKDIYHPAINGERTPIIRSDQFDSTADFWAWVNQHGATKDDVFSIYYKDTK